MKTEYISCRNREPREEGPSVGQSGAIGASSLPWFSVQFEAYSHIVSTRQVELARQEAEKAMRI